MTTTESRSVVAETERRPPPEKRRKTVLFCPDCGFESTAEENWRVERTDEGTELACPDCGNVVAIR